MDQRISPLNEQAWCRWPWACSFGLLLVSLLGARPVAAGPPLVTDDPIPAPCRHWEVFTPAIYEGAGREYGWDFPHLDLNYGVSALLQLSLETGVRWEHPASSRLRGGVSDIELALKYRFTQRGRENHQLHVAFYPQLSVPTGDLRRDLGSGATDLELPIVWLYELGSKARVYGDLRAGLPNGAGARPFFFTGLALERDLSERWTLVGELYGHTREAADAPGGLGFSLGCVYKVRGGDSRDPEREMDLLFAAGRALGPGPRFTLYLGPRFVFR